MQPHRTAIKGKTKKSKDIFATTTKSAKQKAGIGTLPNGHTITENSKYKQKKQNKKQEKSKTKRKNSLYDLISEWWYLAITRGK